MDAPRLDKILVVDLESTCWARATDNPMNIPREIIEIGTAWLSNDGKVTRGESIIVSPVKSKISPYCTSLTGITQEQVDTQGIFLGRATKNLIRNGSAHYIWASWGEYDKEQLFEECKSKDVSYPFGSVHINIKLLHAFNRKIHRGLGLKKALNLEQIELVGRHHSGVDDAYNAAQILSKVLRKI